MSFNLHYGGKIYYRVSREQEILSMSSMDVGKLGIRNYNATQTLIVTYVNVSAHGKYKEKHTFQTILTTNGNDTYAVLIYNRLSSSNAITAFAEGHCMSKTFNTSDTSRLMLSSSNIQENGKFVFLLTTSQCRGKNRAGIVETKFICIYRLSL